MQRSNLIFQHQTTTWSKVTPWNETSFWNLSIELSFRWNATFPPFLGGHDERSVCPWGGVKEQAWREAAQTCSLVSEDMDSGVRLALNPGSAASCLTWISYSPFLRSSALLHKVKSDTTGSLKRLSAGQADRFVILCFNYGSHITALSVCQKQNHILVHSHLLSFQSS